jgi:hypothetical protein
MRLSILPVLALLPLTLTSALHAGTINLAFSLDNGGAGSGYSTSLNSDADCFSLPQANCVIFTGTLMDTDTDGSDMFFAQFPAGIQAIFSPNPSSGGLTLDNTFYDVVPAILSGDPGSPGDGNPFSSTYSGPIFGIQIAPNTPAGVYSGIVTISASCGDDDPNCAGFTVSQNFTVDVIPEPGAFGLFFAGLLPLAGWLTMKRKWRSPASSR